MNFSDPNYRESQLIRLKVIGRLQETGLLNNKLQWSKGGTIL
jgi:hypothetical protein